MPAHLPFGYILCFVTWQARDIGGKPMEIILAICITGLGIFGGMHVIWNQNPVPLKTSYASRTR